jgi:thiamine-phosphate pyrophosphorylase
MHRPFPRLYVIMDAALIGRSELDFARLLADAGAELVQYRNKAASSLALYDSALPLAGLFGSRGVCFLVNDRADVAALVRAGGVHVGQQDDLGVEQARALVGASSWVGLSTHSLDQFQRAMDTSADYLAVGPVFPTFSKANPNPVVGLDFIREVRALAATRERTARKPIVAIGGITLDRAAEAIEAGADSVAVLSDVCAAPDPAAQIALYLQRLSEARTTSV